jgi:hypothetical protein
MTKAKSRLHKKTFNEKLKPIVLFATTLTLISFAKLTGAILDIKKVQVEASEYQKPVVVVTGQENYTEKQKIYAYIVEVFGDKSMEALKIAECESQFDPQRVGDQHLMSFDEKWQEMKGDSIGIFQIRTGGEDFNRARANGMSTDEFRVKLKDSRYNIDYAKTIYDRAGDWTPWYNCANKVL